MDLLKLRDSILEILFMPEYLRVHAIDGLQKQSGLDKIVFARCFSDTLMPFIDRIKIKHGQFAHIPGRNINSYSLMQHEIIGSYGERQFNVSDFANLILLMAETIGFTPTDPQEDGQPIKQLGDMTKDELQSLLATAIGDEDYNLAGRIRDLLNGRIRNDEPKQTVLKTTTQKQRRIK